MPKNTSCNWLIYAQYVNWMSVSGIIHLEFKPERWENRKEIDPFSFAQFGIGPRMCVGRRIAEAEMQLITAHLCMSYKIHLEKEPDSKFDALIDNPMV